MRPWAIWQQITDVEATQITKCGVPSRGFEPPTKCIGNLREPKNLLNPTQIEASGGAFRASVSMCQQLRYSPRIRWRICRISRYSVEASYFVLSPNPVYTVRLTTEDDKSDAE